MSRQERRILILMALFMLAAGLAVWAVINLSGPSQELLDLQQTRQVGAGQTAVYEYQQTQQANR